VITSFEVFESSSVDVAFGFPRTLKVGDIIETQFHINPLTVIEVLSDTVRCTSTDANGAPFDTFVNQDMFKSVLERANTKRKRKRVKSCKTPLSAEPAPPTWDNRKLAARQFTDLHHNGHQLGLPI
jgi:hypothetical protein